MSTATTRPRVVHVVGGLGLGGGQKLTALVAVGLRRRGYDITVVNLGHSGVYEDYLRKNGVPAISIGMRDGLDMRAIGVNVLGVVKLWSLLLRCRWDVVHTHMFRTALLTAFVARLSGARLYGTSHRIYYPRWQPRIERMLSRWQEAVVVDSAAVGEILRAETLIDRQKYVVIHNGIDPAEFAETPARAEARRTLSIANQSIVITCVAHLAPHKGQQHLLEAFARIAGRYPQACLLLVGDGPLREMLTDRATELGLAEHVRLTGARNDLPTVLAASDVLVLPSVFEGFGIVQAEAMHLGLPVIATDRGGSTEVVEDGVTGYLVPFGDISALTGYLEHLVADPAQRAEMGTAGRSRVDRMFTQDAMVDGYEELYSRNARTR